MRSSSIENCVGILSVLFFIALLGAVVVGVQTLLAIEIAVCIVAGIICGAFGTYAYMPKHRTISAIICTAFMIILPLGMAVDQGFMMEKNPALYFSKIAGFLGFIWVSMMLTVFLSRYRFRSGPEVS